MLRAAATAPINIHLRIRHRLRTRVVPSASNDTSSTLVGRTSIAPDLLESITDPLPVTSRCVLFSNLNSPLSPQRLCERGIVFPGVVTLLPLRAARGPAITQLHWLFHQGSDSGRGLGWRRICGDQQTILGLNDLNITLTAVLSTEVPTVMASTIEADLRLDHVTNKSTRPVWQYSYTLDLGLTHMCHSTIDIRQLADNRLCAKSRNAVLPDPFGIIAANIVAQRSHCLSQAGGITRGS